MSWYKKITYWENRKRVKLLSEFRDIVVDYFNNVEYDFSYIKENQNALRIRQEMVFCAIVEKIPCHFVKHNNCYPSFRKSYFSVLEEKYQQFPAVSPKKRRRARK